MTTEIPKEYIGDGVYVAFDGFMLILTTEDGSKVYNTIFLFPSVWKNLKDFAEKVRTS